MCLGACYCIYYTFRFPFWKVKVYCGQVCVHWTNIFNDNSSFNNQMLLYIECFNFASGSTFADLRFRGYIMSN